MEENKKLRPSATGKKAKSRLRPCLLVVVAIVGVPFVARNFLAPSFVRLCLYDANVVPSGAMKDTLLVGDYVISNPLVYRFRDPRPGEIVTFTAYAPSPGLLAFRDMTRAEKIRYVFNGEYGDGEAGGLRLLIKRVVGGPGDVLEIKKGTLFRNGEPVHEPYVRTDAGYDSGPYVVPAGKYFVMGDNRYDSYDSRIFGSVPRKFIRARAAGIYFSVAPVSCPKHGAPIVRCGDGWRCTAGGEEMRPGLDFEPAPWWSVRRIRWKRIGKRLALPETAAPEPDNNYKNLSLTPRRIRDRWPIAGFTPG